MWKVHKTDTEIQMNFGEGMIPASFLQLKLTEEIFLLRGVTWVSGMQDIAEGS